MFDVHKKTLFMNKNFTKWCFYDSKMYKFEKHNGKICREKN